MIQGVEDDDDEPQLQTMATRAIPRPASLVEEDMGHNKQTSGWVCRKAKKVSIQGIYQTSY